MKKQKNSFESDLMEKLRDTGFASAYIMSSVIDNDIDFLPIALGDVAKAHGISNIAEKIGVNRRTLYKVFDKNGNPSFGLISQIAHALGLELQIAPKKKNKKVS